MSLQILKMFRNKEMNAGAILTKRILDKQDFKQPMSCCREKGRKKSEKIIKTKLKIKKIS